MLQAPQVEDDYFDSEPFAFNKISELLNRLGDIPANRVFLHPVPGTATGKDVLELHARTDRYAKVIEGTLVEKVLGTPKARLNSILVSKVFTYLDDNKIGFACGAGGMLRLKSGNIRIPDFSFFSWDRCPGRKLPTNQIPEITPDLVVEILSPQNTLREMELKRRDFFPSGTTLFWEVVPETKIVRVYSDPETFVTVDESGILSGGDVFTGFHAFGESVV